MRKVEIELYSFDELKEEVRSRLLDAKRYEIMNFMMESSRFDYQDVIEKLERLMGVRWLGEGRCSLTIGDYEPMGRCLWRYVEYNVIPYIVSGRMFYHGGKKRRSRVLMNDPLLSCPLSGLWLDEVALEPVMRFRHDWWLGRYPEDYSLRDLFNECVAGLDNAWKEDEEWYSSNEFVADELNERGECFTYEGERIAI